MSKVSFEVEKNDDGTFFIHFADGVETCTVKTTTLAKSIHSLLDESGFQGLRGRRKGTKNKPKEAIASTD